MVKKIRSAYTDDCVNRLRDNDTQLKTPNFSCKELSDAETIVLAKTIQENSYAQTLNLNANGLSNQSIPVLASSLQINRTLTELWLNDNKFGDAGIEQLAVALTSNPVLTKLCLNNNHVEDLGAHWLSFLCIGETTSLRVLWLNDNNIGAAGARALARAVQKKEGALQELYLAGNPLHNTGVKAISLALKGNCMLRKVSLAHTKMTNKGGELLKKALQRNNNLRLLWLKDEKLDDAVRRDIQETLQTSAVKRPKDDDILSEDDEDEDESHGGEQRQLPEETVRIAFHLRGQLVDLPKGSEAREELQESIIDDVAEILSISTTRLRIVELLPGSIIVVMEIIRDKELTDNDLDDLCAMMIQLHQQGILAQGKVLVNVDLSTPPFVITPQVEAEKFDKKRATIAEAEAEAEEPVADYFGDLGAEERLEVQDVVYNLVLQVDFCDYHRTPIDSLVVVHEAVQDMIGELELQNEVADLISSMINEIEVDEEANRLAEQIIGSQELEDLLEELAGARGKNQDDGLLNSAIDIILGKKKVHAHKATVDELMDVHHEQKGPLKEVVVLEQRHLSVEEWHQKRLKFVQKKMQKIITRESALRIQQLALMEKKRQESTGYSARFGSIGIPRTGAHALLYQARQAASDARWQHDMIKAARKKALQQFCRRHEFPQALPFEVQKALEEGKKAEMKAAGKKGARGKK
jgi:Ran GTPase-activating protein (RanGAP) involved in mRNA processing and transport